MRKEYKPTEEQYKQIQDNKLGDELRIDFSEYIHLQSDKEIDKMNKNREVPLKKSVEIVEEILNKILKTLDEVAERGGNYTDDSIKVTVSVEYIPEDK